jgi:hypothetical protein
MQDADDQNHFNPMGSDEFRQPIRFGMGHNHRRSTASAAQWQEPHIDRNARRGRADGGTPADLDQVETAFTEGFAVASDPTSFLRLSNIPFETVAEDGAKLTLLRVEIDSVVDIGSITPHLGGASFRYDPLPASLVSKRRRMRFVYFDGQGLRSLSFADLRRLTPVGSR